MPAARPGASHTTAFGLRVEVGIVAAARDLYRRCRDWTAAHLASDDPLAAAANTGAFIVWGNQPFYPLYVWLLVGRGAWPALLTWLSTPFFVAVAPVSRRHPLASRVLFVAAGVLNTLLSVKALGVATEVGWFLVPCAILAVGFFRAAEWRVGAALCATTALAALAVGHLGVPLHVYTPEQTRSLSHLNLWSLSVLSLYLLYAAGRARLNPSPS